jgi:hypothetical protein
MYCPKCGETMEEVHDGFKCVRGDMPLSEDLAKNLFAGFIAKSEVPPEFTFPLESGYRWGGNWTCPGCGVAMAEEVPGAVRCPQCHRNLGAYLNRLIELHPHL